MGTVAMSGASQFYFTLRNDIDYPDGKHTVFGVVEEKEALDTLATINESPVDVNGRPLEDIRIKHTYVLDDPFDDPPQLAEYIPDKSPENLLFVCKLNPVTQDEDLFTIFSRFGTVTSADIIRDYKRGDGQCYAFIGFETKEACERAYFKMKDVLIDDCRIQVDFSQSISRLWNQYRHCKGSDHPKCGCFTCGATDHIARDCQQGSNNKQQRPEYVLKNDQTQHSGDGRKRTVVKSRADDKSEDREYIDHNRSSRSNHRDHKRRSETDRYRRGLPQKKRQRSTEIIRGDPRSIGIGENYNKRKGRNRDYDVHRGNKRRDEYRR